MESNEEDFVFYGTPIEREEDTSSRKRKVIAAAGNLRSLPAWKQEVTDEEGRRRFHGAFTGGFSAGYYNTAGSKEGWRPQTFTSSRKNRAEVNKQSIYNFLDEDDIKDMGGQPLETSLKFDTFGFTATEVARKQAEREQKNRSSTIPGPVPDELVVPASSSIGAKLLLKMGWRRGHSIKETQATSLHDARREARKALLAFSVNDGGKSLSHTEINQSDTGDSTGKENESTFSSQSTPSFVLNPKLDLYGLGYDPFKHAPEFQAGKYAPGFGIGALEELDVEDEDIYTSAFKIDLGLLGTEIEEDEPSRIITIDDKLRVEGTKKGLLGFKVASSSDYTLKRFQPPTIPPDYKPVHKFTSPLETTEMFLEQPPPEIPPPEDGNLRLLIEGFANLVARCGRLFEDLSKEKNKSNPLFSFLIGGSGHGYYARKLWEAKSRRSDQGKTASVEPTISDQRMTAGTRGKILGERPLERSSNDSPKSANTTPVVHFQSNLSDTFTNSAALADSSECPKPFKEDPPKQMRFELFLKEKYQGGLRTTSYSGADKLSEAERARERLDFEAAAETITKEKWNKKDGLQSIRQNIEFSGYGDEHFVSGGLREEFQWRPSPLLCKRFDIVDPFMGKICFCRLEFTTRPLPPLCRICMLPATFATRLIPAQGIISLLDSIKFTRCSHAAASRAPSPAPAAVGHLAGGARTSRGPPSLYFKASNFRGKRESSERPVTLRDQILVDNSDLEFLRTATAFLNKDLIEEIYMILPPLIKGELTCVLGKRLGDSIPPINRDSIPIATVHAYKNVRCNPTSNFFDQPQVWSANRNVLVSLNATVLFSTDQCPRPWGNILIMSCSGNLLILNPDNDYDGWQEEKKLVLRIRVNRVPLVRSDILEQQFIAIAFTITTATSNGPLCDQNQKNWRKKRKQEYKLMNSNLEADLIDKRNQPAERVQRVRALAVSWPPAEEAKRFSNDLAVWGGGNNFEPALFLMPNTSLLHETF
ncbi:hypothetical protein KSP39_PZI024093 [Platanthera zijinensis]|uniref:SURP motif domain-containing protein n=1 Tax=Platanthera zijinensis TaxID=2320716 RepID=A0AAP0FTS8_9ASPA